MCSLAFTASILWRPKLSPDQKIPTIKIDDKEYDLDQLSGEAKAQLASLQFVDSELQRLNAKAATLQTARASYAKALNEALAAKQTMN